MKKRYKHKKTGIIGEVLHDNHLHFVRVSGIVGSQETLHMSFIEDSSDWELVEPKVLLTTEDGKDLYESDYNKVELYWAYQQGNKTWTWAANADFSSHHLNLVKKTYNYTPFVSKEARDKFVDKKNEEKLLDSKVLSYNDVVKLIDKTDRDYYTHAESICTIQQRLKELVKSKQ